VFDALTGLVDFRDGAAAHVELPGRECREIADGDHGRTDREDQTRLSNWSAQQEKVES
jgi:hypothetical protein